MSAFTKISFACIWIGTLWSLGDAADAPAGPPSPCDNYPCGPPEGADCQVIGSTYRCHCKEGYEEMPANYCVPKGPCGRYPCGPNSERCLWLNGDEYRCKCKRGFTEDKLQFPTCVPAEGDCEHHPCGIGGLCRATPDGKHTCECADGFVPGPSTAGITCKATEKVTCETHPCGDESVGRCVQTESGYFCVCREGTSPHFTDAGLPTCIENEGYDPCYQGACGEKGTTCVFDGKNRFCTCEEGYVARPVNIWDDKRCYVRTPEDNEETGTPEEEQQGNKGNHKLNSTVLIAGGVVGAILLLGMIGAGVGYRHFKASRNAGINGREATIDFEGRDAASGAEAESDVLINARHEDWAH